MKHVVLNNTDLSVSRVCLGADHFGGKLGRDEAFAMLDRFREAGGNFVDTANIYARRFSEGYSASERLLGEYLASRGRSSLIVATKGAHPRLDTMHVSRVSRREIAEDLDESLRELGLDCIDFYWLHRDDPALPIGEILEIMEDLAREGKIRFYGGSNYAVSRLAEAAAYAKAHGLHGFSAVSNMWSPAVQNEDNPLSRDDTLVRFEDADLSVLDETGLALVPYSSTAKGWFSKKHAGCSAEKLDKIYENPHNLALLEKFASRSRETGRPVQTILLEYMGEGTRQIVPITSVSSMAQLEEVCLVD